MSGVHLHLLLNHAPVIGTIGSLLLLLVALFRRSDDLRRAAFGAFILVALLTIPVYLSGEPAEDAVRGLQDVPRAMVHEHEEAALFGMISASLSGVLALVAFVMDTKRGGMHRPTAIALLIVALWSTSVLARVGYLGGLIRHSEIRPATTASTSHR